MTNPGSARGLADQFADVGSRLHGHRTVDGVLAELTRAAEALVPHADHASTSVRRRNGQFDTAGATGDVPAQVDRIQYDLGHGPCVDAVLSRHLVNAVDLRTDPRWPAFGRRAAETTGILSMLAFRLFFEDETAELLAGLNLYAAKPRAFDEADDTAVILLGTHGALALAAADRQQRAEGLALAQQSNRTIGTAIGILMSRLLVTADQAFDLLRISSQRTNRKLRCIAQDVIDTGVLDIPDPGRPAAEREEPG